MQIASERRLIKSSIQSLWDQVYAVNRWKDWDPSIEKVELLESPKVGAMGSLKFLRHYPVHFVLLEVQPRRLLKWKTQYLWVQVFYSYCIIPNSDGAIVVFEAECEGHFLWLASWLLENRIYRHFKKAMNGLKARLDRGVNRSAERNIDRPESTAA